MNYYELLEVSSNASLEVINAAYNALLDKYHQDSGSDENFGTSEDSIDQIKIAFSVLSDNWKRAEYDRIIQSMQQLNSSYSDEKIYSSIEKELDTDIKDRLSEVYRLIFASSERKPLNYSRNTAIMAMILIFALFLPNLFLHQGSIIHQLNKTEDIKPWTISYSSVYTDNSTRIKEIPFEIKTDGSENSYFIKLEDYNTKETIMTLFIVSGKSFKPLVPMGSYTIKFAKGRDWYGIEKLFGKGTSYFTSDKVFEFTRDGKAANGAPLGLTLDLNNNPDVYEIEDTDW